MSKRDKQELSVEAQRELEAVDTVLAGGAVGARHAGLAELTVALRALRPQPREEYARSLDATAACEIKGERHRPAPGGTSSRRPRGAGPWHGARGNLRGVPALPALGLVIAATVVAAVAVPLTLSGGGPAQVHGPAWSSKPSQPASSVQARANGAMGTAGPAARSSAGRAGGERADLAPVGPGGAPAAGARQVERTASLDVGVAPASIESTAQQVFSIASAFHGYVQQSSVSSGGAEEGGASFDLRLPSSNLTGALAALAHLGHVRSENDTTNDVTGHLDSLQRSLGDAQAERASLLTQLAHTSDPKRVAALQAQLRALEMRISRVRGELGALRGRIDYTSVAFSLTPERSNSAAVGDLTPGGAAHDAARILTAALAVLVLVGAALLPLAAIVAAGWIALILTRRRLREQALGAG